jgi:hypothetical protein
LLPIFERWFLAALPVISTKDFPTSEVEFRRAWPAVKTPVGSEGSIQRAYQRALSSPPPPDAAQFRARQMRVLVALCRELQHERGDKPFYLASRDLAAILGFGGEGAPMRAWRMLEKLCHVGILRKVRSGSQIERRANEYRYLPDVTGHPNVKMDT